jgi:quinoprotein glucose dehydrogenase
LSGDLFAWLCVSCHGDQGRGIPGGSAPSLLNAGSVDSIKQIIQNGGVEMPAYQLQLTEQEMSLLSRYVNQLVQ